MADFSTIKQEIDENIVPFNDSQDITGEKLNTTLKDMLDAVADAIGEGYQFLGSITPASTIGSPSGKAFYLAAPGEYNNFPSYFLVGPGCLGVFLFDGEEWDLKEVDIIGTAFVSSEDFNSAMSLIEAELSEKLHRVPAVEGNIPSFADPEGNIKDSGVAASDIAKKDGFYSTLGAGYAQSLLGNGASVPAVFLNRPSGGDVSVATGVASLKTIKGNDIVWNQLMENGDFADGTSGWDAYRASASIIDGAVVVTPTAVDNSAGFASPVTTHKYINGHKYMACAIVKGASGNKLYFSAYYGAIPSAEQFQANGNWQKIASIFTATSGMADFYALRVAVVQDTDASLNPFYIKSVYCVDLTLMGGLFASLSGDTGIATFRQFYDKPYYPYNAGVVIGNKAEALVTDGANQWDEEWEVGGYYTINGEKSVRNDAIRSKNLIRVFPNTAYYFRCESHTNPGDGVLLWYDSDKNYIGFTTSPLNTSKTSPAGAGYAAFYIAPETIYNHDIQIALYHSGGTIPTTYHPHWQSRLPLNLTTRTGKLNGQGESVTIFPDGMHGVGTAFDAYISDAEGVYRRARKVMKKVDLGSLEWGYSADGGYFYVNIAGKAPMLSNILQGRYALTSESLANMPDKSIRGHASMNAIYIKDTSFNGDINAFVASLSGVYLYYELAAPEEYVLDEPFALNARIDDWGTEVIDPQGTDAQGVPYTAPFSAEIVYGPNVQDELRNLPVNFINKASLQNALEAMKTAGLISAYTMTLNADGTAYNFMITPPTE